MSVSRWPSWASFSLLAALLGCGPQVTPGEPVRVVALVYSASGNYEPLEVPLTTLEDPLSMSGRAATFIGGARIEVNPNDPILASATTDEQIAQAMIKASGRPPRASFVDQGGLLWPADFHTWNMTTAYFNLESAFHYFVETGVPSEEITGTPLYYFPEFVLTPASDKPLRDNALFYAPVGSFMLLPFESLQKVPLAMNFGVMAHEFAHKVFNEKVYGGAAVPAPLLHWTGGLLSSDGQANVLKALDEGFADFHAYGATCEQPGGGGCNPRFLDASIDAQAAQQRDLAGVHCLTENLLNATNTFTHEKFTGQGLDYELGTVVASALYHAGLGSGMGTLQKALVAAYDNEDPNKQGFAQHIAGNLSTPGNITLHTLADILLEHVPETNLRERVCNQMIDRLGLDKNALPNCPPSSDGGLRACSDPPVRAVSTGSSAALEPGGVFGPGARGSSQELALEPSRNRKEARR